MDNDVKEIRQKVKNKEYRKKMKKQNPSTVFGREYEWLTNFMERMKLNAITSKDWEIAYEYIKNIALMHVFLHHRDLVNAKVIKPNDVAHDVATYIIERLMKDSDISVSNWNGFILYATRHVALGKFDKSSTYREKVGTFTPEDVEYIATENNRYNVLDLPNTTPNIEEWDIVGTDRFPLFYVSIKYGLDVYSLDRSAILYKVFYDEWKAPKGKWKRMITVEEGEMSLFLYYLVLQYFIYTDFIPNTLTYIFMKSPDLVVTSMINSHDNKMISLFKRAVHRIEAIYAYVFGDYKEFVKIVDKNKKGKGLKHALTFIKDVMDFLDFLTMDRDSEAFKEHYDYFKKMCSQKVDDIVKESGVLEDFQTFLSKSKAILQKEIQEKLGEGK